MAEVLERPHSSFIDLAPVGNARYIDGSCAIVNFVHDPVITDTNTPFAIAAAEFLASRRTRSRCETFKARYNAGNHLRGQTMQFLFRART